MVIAIKGDARFGGFFLGFSFLILLPAERRRLPLALFCSSKQWSNQKSHAPCEKRSANVAEALAV